MKLVEAKIVENSKEDPASEPDQDPKTWLIEANLSEDIIDWETVRLDFRISEVESEIVESSMSEPHRLTIRTHGKSPLKKVMLSTLIFGGRAKAEEFVETIRSIILPEISD